MATDKRERQRAARQSRQEAETTEDRQTRRKRTGLRVAAIIAVALVAAFAYSMIFGGSDDDNAVTAEADESDGSEDEAATEPVVIEGVTISEAAGTTEQDAAGLPGEAFVGRAAADGCPAADGSAEAQTQFDGPAPWCIDVSASYTADVATSAGSIKMTLDPMAAPVTVNNFVFLARSNFYNGSIFHRAVPDFMVQGGQQGEGSPGYQLGDNPDFTGELPTAEPNYPHLSVAMANVGADPATASSQFFIVSGPQGEALPPDYTRFGQVTEGEDVVRAIEDTSELPEVANT